MVIAEIGQAAPDGEFQLLPVDLATSRLTVGLADAVGRSLGSTAIDIVPSYRSLLIEYDPDRISSAGIEALIRQEIVAHRTTHEDISRTVTIPVAYGGEFGPDLDDVATHTGLTPGEVIAAHCGGDAYRVAFLGFSPGYAYLLGLPPGMATPRLSSPRPRVPAGSVAIGGEQTGIYPQATPGGWRLIGQTAVPLFDVVRSPAALLRPGDRIRFRPIEPAEHEEIARQVRLGKYRPEIDWPVEEPPPEARRGVQASRSRSRVAIEVVSPGLLTTVQDAGRPGLGAQGISPGGALDRAAYRAANRLLGNYPDAAVLEMSVTGPTLRPNRAVEVAVTGADLGATVDGRPAPHWEPFTIAAGSKLTFLPDRASRTGVRGYLAVAGGIDVPSVIGSRSTDLTAAFGGMRGRALIAGDRLPVGGARKRHPNRSVVVGPRPREPGGEVTLRVVVGPHDDLLAPGDLARLLAAPYAVTSQSSHMGVRLSGPALRVAVAGNLVSEGIATGTVQVPADGQPIILLSGRGTVGGYAKVACVIDADLDLLAQLRPGTTVRFVAVTLEDAVRLGRRYRETLGWLTGDHDEELSDQSDQSDRLSPVERSSVALLRVAEEAVLSAPRGASRRQTGVRPALKGPAE